MDCIDVLTEVLSHLPAKQVCRLRCLCKSANALVDNQFFNMLQSSRVVDDNGVFITDNYGRPTTFSYIDPHSGIPSSFLDGATLFAMLGCSRGLVVCEVVDDSSSFPMVCIQNPVTKAELYIPPPPGKEEKRFVKAGAVVVPCHSNINPTDDVLHYYKLLCWEASGEWSTSFLLHVYCFRDGCWKPTKMVPFGSRSIKNESPVAVDDTVYLVSDCSFAFTTDPYIVAIDIEDESAKRLPFPPSTGRTSDQDQVEISLRRKKSESSPSLCFIRWYASEMTFRIWALEDKEKWSWSASNIVEVKITMAITRFTLISNHMLVFTVGDTLNVYKLMYQEGKMKMKMKLMKTERLPTFYPNFFRYSNTLCSVN